VVGGLVFAVLAWGFDALSLTRSHVVLPLGKFLPGLILCIFLCSFVGWLSARIDKAAVAFFLWIGLSVVLVLMILWLPLRWMYWLTRLVYPAYASYLEYPALVGTSQFIIFGSIGLAILASIAGLIENLLIDSAMEKQGNGGVVGMIFLVAMLLGIGGFLMDNILNPNFRTSAESMDALIQFAVQNKDNDVDPIVARTKHLRTMTQLGVEVYTRPYQLVVQNYDPVMLTQIDYLVDFSGDFYTCTVVGNAPVYCRSVLIRNYHPLRRLISAKASENW
jgi:hypothetical protein